MRSTGEPLEESVQRAAADKFGQDFSHVRVHTDRRADASAIAVGARAYTVGSHIVFQASKYRPGTSEGRRLLDHELTHVAQQPPAATVPSEPLPLGAAASPAEHEADAAAGARTVSAATPTALAVQRQPDPDIDVDVEGQTPQETARLRSAGVRLPAVSAQAADPRAAADYLDRRVTAVYFNLYFGGYLIVCKGLDKPVFVADAYVDLGLRRATPINHSVYAAYDDAVKDIPFGPFASGTAQPFAYYRGAGGAVIAPTVVSPATTPRLAWMMNDAIHEYVAQVQRELTVLALTLVAASAAVIGVRIGFARLGRYLKEPIPPELLRTSPVPGEAPGIAKEPEPPAGSAEPEAPSAGPAMPSPRTETEPSAPTTQPHGPAEPPRADKAGSPQGPTAQQPPATGQPPARPPLQRPAAGRPASEDVRQRQAAQTQKHPATAARTPDMSKATAQARALVKRLRAEGKEVVANLGGTGAAHEPPDGINVNLNIKAVSRKDIPNHVEADGSDVGQLFEPGSLDAVEGYYMAPEAIDWNRAAPGAFRALRSGGSFKYSWRGASSDVEVCAKALEAAGFKNIETDQATISARKP
ncbi:hypothetical protein GCM10009565_33670 [Amycolatopsis albidoflavus]